MMTIEEIQVRKECQTFDCKSIQIDPKSLAVPIVAMANANGGVIMKAEKCPEGSEAVTCIKTLHAKKDEHFCWQYSCFRLTL